MNVREIVIIYNNKHYVSIDVLNALRQKTKLDNIKTLIVGTEIIYEIQDLSLIEKLPKYNLDAALSSFTPVGKDSQTFKMSLEDCVYLEDIILMPLVKLPVERRSKKYYVRHKLPVIKIFGRYFIVCNKCKDVNSNVAIITNK